MLSLKEDDNEPWKAGGTGVSINTQFIGRDKITGLEAELFMCISDSQRDQTYPCIGPPTMFLHQEMMRAPLGSIL